MAKTVSKTKSTPKKKSNAGRPLKFKSPEEMQLAIDKYIDECENNTREVYSRKLQEITTLSAPIPLTIEGLVCVLGIDRKTLLNYQNKDEFFHTVKEIKDRVLKNQVEMAMCGEADKTMTIFLLKNNQSYADKTEVKLEGDMKYSGMEIEYVPAKT